MSKTIPDQPASGVLASWRTVGQYAVAIRLIEEIVSSDKPVEQQLADIREVLAARSQVEAERRAALDGPTR